MKIEIIDLLQKFGENRNEYQPEQVDENNHIKFTNDEGQVLIIRANKRSINITSTTASVIINPMASNSIEVEADTIFRPL